MGILGKVLFWGLCFGLVQTGLSWADDRSDSVGRNLYMSYGCAVCHGPSGDGQGLRKVKRELPPTNFTDRKSYRFGHDQNSIKHSIQFGIKEQGSVMPAFNHISKEELEEMSLYLISLQKEE